MNIEEVIWLKETAQGEITAILNKFSKETGLQVNGLKMIAQDCTQLDDRYIKYKYIIELKVEI